MEKNEKLVYVPRSILDTDLYKFTMQQAVLYHFPETRALYKFTHRNPDVLFPRKCIDLFRLSVQRFRDLCLSTEERDWLASACPYFSKEYLAYLSEFRFDPAQVSIDFIPVSANGEEGRVEFKAEGLWREAILWEVPLMACLSELYFKVGVTDWNYEGQRENAATKARTLLQEGCVFVEFGTRRRRSFDTQDILISAMKQEADRSSGPGVFVGTSNVYLAMKYNLRPGGTTAHEWFMGVAALTGYKGANATAMKLWQQVYPKDLPLVALTDTFSTKVFFRDLVENPALAQEWGALRQDSGDPFDFGPAAKAMYESIGIDIRTKSIMYSDSLTLDRALQLQAQCADLGIKCSFGIGTFLTNDFKTASSGYKEKSRALNMVIKLAKVDDKDCVKISDDLTKNTGNQASVMYVKQFYGLSN